MAENQYLRYLLSTINGGAQAVITTRTKFYLFLFTDNEFLNVVIATSYGDLVRNRFRKQYVAHAVILAFQDDKINEINKRIAALFPGEGREYLSRDYVSFTTDNYIEAVQLYPREFLNKVEDAYMPLHELRLKIKLPIILLSGLTRGQDIAAGTRLIITKLLEHEIIAEVLTGAAVGEEVVIRRSVMKSRDTIPLTRCQFPLKIAFAMHIERCKALRLHIVGFYLKPGAFDENDKPTYIGISITAKETSKTKITTIKKNDLPDGYTKTIIHQHIPKNFRPIDRIILQAVTYWNENYE